jgi:hypothetical protein
LISSKGLKLLKASTDYLHSGSINGGGVMVKTAVKARVFRVGVTLSALAVLVEVLGAGKKWQ